MVEERKRLNIIDDVKRKITIEERAGPRQKELKILGSRQSAEHIMMMTIIARLPALLIVVVFVPNLRKARRRSLFSAALRLKKAN